MISLFRSSVRSILPLLLLVLSTLPASADRFQYGDLWFETTSENTCEVISPLDGSHYAFTEISIPELAVYNGQFYTVTVIGWRAFYECSSLTSIAIPSSVTTIGTTAFAHCESLTSIDIPSSVTTIGQGAFYYCSSLASIDIPSVTTIGYEAFQGCSSLTSINVDTSNTAYASLDGVLFNKDVTTIIIYPKGKTDSSYNIPNSVTTIGNDAFSWCESLTSITIPSSVTTIGYGAFSVCSSLTSIDIPSSVTTIGNHAFSWCKSLTSIVIPSSVTTIGDGAFADCLSLTSIDIPSSVTTIGDVSFIGCSSLTSIDIPSSVTTIGDRAFSGCSSLTSITIPNGVTTIGDEAFSWCTSLTSIDIPSSVTTIGDRAFNRCASLPSINVDASNIAYASLDGVLFNKDFTTIVTYPEGKTDSSYNIPNSVTTIGEYAFASCSSLTSITIPSSVTTIGEYAFAWCWSLTNIYNYALVPQSIDYYVFKDVPSSATLHVVKGYKDVYEAAEGWNQFYVVDDLELPTAIGSVTTDAPATEIYTLDGRRADHTAKGIGIVRTADGKTRKVMTK